MFLSSQFDSMFRFSQIFMIVMFVLVFSVFIFVFVRIFKTWRKNEKSPRLTVPATVVTKRTHYSSHHHHHGHATHHTSSSYYATFEVESGDRMELLIPVTEFGLLVEGDRGNLTFQGTRFLSFERT